ncbi:MAG: methionyl-tRNA formyltransferase [Bacteroidetes bacterium]|nr:methionyl-tRNA formyltransferase [Bacteroidota bacterium]
MKLVFWGEDSFSNIVLQSLLDSGFNVVLVITPYYNNLIHKRLENTCICYNIEYIRVLDLKHDNLLRKLEYIRPDLMVIAHFEKLLLKKIIDIPKKGCINLHPSLLPYYRGMAPQHWPIINGETETGITVHYVDENPDTGDIILQQKIQINQEMYVSDLQLEFSKIYKSIVVDAIRLIDQEQFTPIKQSHLPGSYYGKLKKDQCRINLNSSRFQILNLIRGVSKPYFGAFLDDMIIYRAHLATNSERKIISTSGSIGLNYCDEFGFYLNLLDGIIIIDKYEHAKI